jgi:hypothetical protein
MDQEVYYNIAKDAMVQCVLLLHMMVTILNAHHCCHAFVGRWQDNIDTGNADTVAAAHVKIQERKKIMDKLLLLLRWVKAYHLPQELLSSMLFLEACRHQPLRLLCLVWSEQQLLGKACCALESTSHTYSCYITLFVWGEECFIIFFTI